MNLPNRLTIARVFMIPIFLLALYGGFFTEPTARVVAVAVFLIASVTDFLDGFLARRMNLVTDFGKFMDPLADKLLVCAALVAMVDFGDIAAWVVIVIISREFIVTGLRLVAATKNEVISAGFWGKLKTVSQIIMIAYVLLNMNFDGNAIISGTLVYIVVCLTVVSGVDYLVKNWKIVKPVDKPSA